MKNNNRLIFLVTMLVTLSLSTAHGSCNVEIDSYKDEKDFLVMFHDCPDHHENYVAKIWRTGKPESSHFCLVIKAINSPGSSGLFKVPKPRDSNVVKYALLDFSYKKEEAERFCSEYSDY